MATGNYDAFLETLAEEGSTVPDKIKRSENRYDSFLKDQSGAANANLYSAERGTPKDFADAETLSREAGLPQDFVFKNPTINALVKREKKKKVVANNPAMQNVFLQDPNAAGVVQNDLENLDRVTASPLFNVGAEEIRINGELKMFTKRPEASDFPINGERGFMESIQTLREAQAQWDYAKGSDNSWVQDMRYRMEGIERSGFEHITHPFARGWTNFENAFNLSLYELGVMDPMLDAQQRAAQEFGSDAISVDKNVQKALSIAQGQKNRDKYLVPPDIKAEIQAISDAKGPMGVLIALAQNPRGGAEILLESAGFYSGVLVPALASSRLKFATSSLPALRGAPELLTMAEGSFLANYSASLLDAIQANGIDLQNAEDVYRALTNEQIMNQAREYGRARAIPIAVFDSVSMGVAGKLLPLFPKTTGGAIAGTAAEVGVQATTGASGEFFSQKNVGEFNLTEIMLEALLEVPLSIPEGVINYMDVQQNIRREVQRKEVQVARAEKAANNLRETGDILAETEALQNGTVGRAAIEKVLNQSNPDAKIEIDATTYQEIVEEAGGLDRLKIGQPRSVREQLGEALDVNGSIVMPTSEFVSAFSGTEVYQRLIDHVRLEPGGMTLAEAQAYRTMSDPNLEVTLMELQTKASTDVAFEESRQKVRDYVLKDLQSVNRFTPEVNEHYATHTAAYFASRAARLGVTPDVVFFNSGLNIQGEVGEGTGTFGQNDVQFTEDLSDAQFLTSDLGPASVTGSFNKPLNLPVELVSTIETVPLTLEGSSTLEAVRNNWDVEKTKPISIEVAADGGVSVVDGADRLQVARELGETNIPAEVRYLGGGQQQTDAFNPDALMDLDAQTLNQNAYFQDSPDVQRVLRRQPDNLTPEEQVVFDEFLSNREDREGILQRLEEHKDTPWAKQAVEGIFTRAAMEMVMRGETPNFQSSLDSKQIRKLREALTRGPEGMWAYLEGTGGMMGHAAKPVNNVNSSFINCEPSSDCAKYCYATEGNYRYANVLVKSEMITMAIEMSPERAARTVAREYKATAEFANNKALRLFDKGDGDLKWVPFIDALNREGIRVQIFSKKPDFLRAVDKQNLRLLSVDESNAAMADENQDLPVAFIYSNKGQIDALARMVERGQLQVVLPVKLGRTILDGSTVKELKSTVKGVGKYICPIDAGHKKIGKNSDNAGWNCTKCDKNAGLGCFFGTVTKAVKASAEVKPVSPQEKAKRILELRTRINELNAATGQDMADAGSIYTAGSEGLLREVDALLGDLLRDYEPGGEGQDALSIGSGIGSAEFGAEGTVRGIREPSGTRDDVAARRVIPIKSFKQGESRRGFYTPESATITLLEAADLSTYLHESAHFYFENDTILAAELINKENLTEGEQSIVDDVSSLLRWFGIEGAPSEQLATWFELDFEQKRVYHERVAESFERYIFSGKAPSVELTSSFQRFAGWLMQVYRSIKKFMERFPASKQLNPEIRAIFDRMLATAEEIQTAEDSRAMQPLFMSPEEAGMTEAEYRNYINNSFQPSADAQAELRAKALRDMQWLTNARTREIKRLQRDGRELRRAAYEEARAEILDQPIYKAWAFLTNKRSAQDRGRLQDLEPPRSTRGPVDPAIDTLNTAIAKLGGLNKAELVSNWGVDPKDKSPVPLFGTPTYRVKGGLSIDAMGELLVEQGYLTADEDGKYDVAQFEERFMDSIAGNDMYSVFVNPEILRTDIRAGEFLDTSMPLGAGRFDLEGLTEVTTPENVQAIQALDMVGKDGIHPDIVANMFGFDSGSELVQKLTGTDRPAIAIEGRTDQKMLERHAEVANDQAIARSADEAIHNEARARFVAQELNAIGRTLNDRDTKRASYEMAREYANRVLNDQMIRNIMPVKYSHMASRAARRAREAMKSGDRRRVFAEKSNQLLAITLAKRAHEARTEVDRGLRYLRKFQNEGTRKNIDVDFRDQIDQVLERFDLKARTNKSIDRRKGLGAWLKAQVEAGIVPDIPLETFLNPDQIQRYQARLQQETQDSMDAGQPFGDSERIAILKTFLDEPVKKNFKEITLSEFRGLVDTVRQIDHIGRLKKRLLTAKSKKDFEVVVDEMTRSIDDNAGNRLRNNREPSTSRERWMQGMRNFGAAHLKVASLARIMDGGKDGGPVWEYLVRPANDAGNYETEKRAQAVQDLSRIMKPLLEGGKLEGRKTFFKSVNRSFTRAEVIAIALNVGNEGNLQRLLDGEGWTQSQIQPILESLTEAEWYSVQETWNYISSFKEEIAAKERKLTGKEPDWVVPMPFSVLTRDGKSLNLPGGYYPAVYDRQASRRAGSFADAEEIQRQLKGAFTAATTRQSFLKARADKVVGRPLRYSLDAVFDGVNDIIHDLAWSPFLIDANRLMRSDRVDKAIRDRYGAEYVSQIKSWLEAVAEGRGKPGFDGGIFRHNITAAGLGYSLSTALLQLTGLTQSIVRTGAKWIGAASYDYLAHPITMTRDIQEQSSFMKMRTRTRFREMAELTAQVRGQSKFRDKYLGGVYMLMTRFQFMVDAITWKAGFEKAVSEGHAEDRAVAMADQAVIDAQGGGQNKDLSQLERDRKLFTVFYSYMNTALNLGVVTAMTEKSKAKLVGKMLMLYTVPSVLGLAMKDGLTPGDAEDDWEGVAKRLASEQISYIMGLFVYVREMSALADIVTGGKYFSYNGPIAMRWVADIEKAAQQTRQMEFDMAFVKSMVNLAGVLFGIPSVQINKTIKGIDALAEGETENPFAVFLGYQTP